MLLSPKVGLQEKYHLVATAQLVMWIVHGVGVEPVLVRGSLAEIGAADQLRDSATIVDIDPCSLFQVGAEIHNYIGCKYSMCYVKRQAETRRYTNHASPSRSITVLWEIRSRMPTIM